VVCAGSGVSVAVAGLRTQPPPKRSEGEKFLSVLPETSVAVNENQKKSLKYSVNVKF